MRYAHDRRIPPKHIEPELVLLRDERGGPMWNLGVHWIDYLLWLTGRKATGVYGTAVGPFGAPERQIEDSAQASNIVLPCSLYEGSTVRPLTGCPS